MIDTPTTVAPAHPTRNVANLHSILAGALGVGIVIAAWLAFIIPGNWHAPSPTALAFGVAFAAFIPFLVWLIVSSGEEDQVED